jgi:enamine deaminase RidA (YjgF/YER057c/UK114 family)
MTKRAVYPDGNRSQANAIKVSPGVVSNGHLFMTGMTGSAADGSMPADPEAQFRAAFDKIGRVLAVEGLTFADVVEMTSYHVGLGAHFDLFNAVRSDYVREPWPAWTAVEVAGLRREGALVEIRVIAATK